MGQGNDSKLWFRLLPCPVCLTDVREDRLPKHLVLSRCMACRTFHPIEQRRITISAAAFAGGRRVVIGRARDEGAVRGMKGGGCASLTLRSISHQRPQRHHSGGARGYQARNRPALAQSYAS